MSLIERCRTAALGGHLDRCDVCGYEIPSYNSCRNRHCPKCQTLAKERWLQERQEELLPVGYFHLVFTLPHALNPLVLCNERALLALLFAAVADTLQAFAHDPQWRLQGQLGFLAVLHTWSQTLIDHFHLHCLIPAGALKADGSWQSARESFLFRTQSLAKAFRSRYLDLLGHRYQKHTLLFAGSASPLAAPHEFARLLDSARHKPWIVYAKRPFAGPQQVLDYLGRYTHRVAISNHRILSIDDGGVSFSYRDRRDHNRRKQMSLDGQEFIRRFLLHVRPPGFMKIRHFGFLANPCKADKLKRIRAQFAQSQLPPPTSQSPAETVAEMMLRYLMSRPASTSKPSQILALSAEGQKSDCPHSPCAQLLAASTLPSLAHPFAIPEAALRSPSAQHSQPFATSGRIGIREQSP
jgi:hypothetical protein